MPTQPQTISNMRLLHRSFHYSEFSGVFVSRKSPNNATALQEVTTSPFLHPIPETQSLMKSTDASPFSSQDHPSQTARGHHVHSPLEKRGEGQRCPEGKGHTWTCGLSSLIQWKRTTRGHSVSKESHSGIFSQGSMTLHWAVSGNNSFIIGEVMWLQTPLLHWVREMIRQHHHSLCLLKATWPPFMLLRNVSGLSKNNLH